MKKYIALIIAFGFSLSVHAQNKNSERDERIKSLKIAFITENLNLSPSESEKFWPVYNQFETAEDQLRSKYHPTKPVEEMTDAEALAFLDGRIKADEQLWKLNKKYISDLKDILSPKQIAALVNIEREFKKKMLRSIQENRKGGKDGDRK